ncbi:hypothetical protein HZA41_02985, partial [Candidatus Peregrinibacteria bacterium]|nr:hypothetical protein [Candidatus Peregrinibacteria bacterium]
MTDPQARQQGSGTLPTPSPEVLPATPTSSDALENGGELERVDRLDDRREIYRESDRERVDLDLERQETDEMAIERIDISKGIEAQKANFEVLRSNVRGILIKFFKNHKPEEIASLDKILTIQMSGTYFHPSEEAALTKIREIASHPNSSLAQDYEKQWKTGVDRAFEGYKTASEIKTDLEQGNEKGRYTAYIKEHPYRFAGLVALGAVGAYSIYRWFSKKEDEKKSEEAKASEKSETPAKKEKGFLGKIWDIGKILTLSVGAVTLGVVLGPDKWKEWVKKYVGVNLTGEALKSFWKKIKEGKVVEAFGLLHEEKETFDPVVEKAAKVIGIEPQYLQFYFKEKTEYKNFLGGNFVNKGIYEILKNVPNFHIPLWIDTEEEKKLKEAEIKIGEYLQKHQETINEKLPHAKTLEEVIRGLVSLNVIDADLKQEESPESHDPEHSAVLDEQEYQNFQKSLGDAGAPHLQKAFKTWHEKGFSLLQSYCWIPEIVSAAWEDKVPLITHEGTTALWVGSKFLVLTSLVTITGVFNDLMKGEYSDAVTEYWNGAKVFIPIGAVTVGLAN